MKWVNKKQIILIFTKLHFKKKKIKKNTCRYHYQNLDDMIYSSWDVQQNKLKLVILGHFLPFYPSKNRKIQNFEKWKNLLQISSFYTCAPKIIIIWCTVPEILSGTDKHFCHFGPLFAFLPLPLMILNIKILKKNEKNAWIYHPFIHTSVP